MHARILLLSSWLTPFLFTPSPPLSPSSTAPSPFPSPPSPPHLLSPTDQRLRYQAGDWLLFGAETFGLSPDALNECVEGSRHGGGLARIPIDESYVRSLNLAVSVGVGVYEALRQLSDGAHDSA